MRRYFEILKEVSRTQALREASTPSPSTEQPAPAGASNGSTVQISEDPGPTASATARAAEPAPDTYWHPAPETSPQEALFDGIVPPASTGAKKVKIVPDRREVLIPNATDDSVVETYRRLRTKIQQQHLTKPIRSLLIASPGAGEGKTVTVLNLAWSFGLLPSFRVLVIDGDLRRGSVNDVLGADRLPGLSDYVEGTVRMEDVVLSADEAPFDFVQSGTSDIPAPELLTSPKLRSFIQEVSQNYDLVLVDSPPVNLMSDAQTLASACDGVLMVARAFSTTNRAFEKALNDLTPFRIVGTVLNGGMRAERRSYYYRNYSRAHG